MPIPGPASVLRVANQGYEALDRAVSLVPKVAAIVTDIEGILLRVHTLIDEIDDTNRRASEVVARSDKLVTSVQATTDTATALVERLTPLLDGFQPTLERLEPIVARIVSTTSPDEVESVVRLIDALPSLVDRLDTDVLPILETLNTVAPDLRDLLDVSRELNEMLGSVPGLGRIKKRIEENQEAEDAARAARRPPVEAEDPAE